VNRSQASAARRTHYLGISYRRLATALLLDRRPRDKDLILFNLCVVEAALSGDRPQLLVALRILRRLGDYVTTEVAFEQEIRLFLWLMGATAVNALRLLEIEFHRATTESRS
jgi:hypothetical protein